MTPLATLRTVPRRYILAGAVALLVLVLLARSQCKGSDPDDPTVLQVTSQQTVDEALPTCTEDCGRWMAHPPFWYEIEASDAQVAEYRSAGWTVNGVPAEPTVAQESNGGDGSIGVGTFLRRFWWAFPLIVGFWVFGRYWLGRKPGPGQ